MPTLLTNTIGKVIVNKGGATITLGSGFTANDSIILDAGTLDASTTYRVIYAKKSWAELFRHGCVYTKDQGLLISPVGLRKRSAELTAPHLTTLWLATARVLP